MAEQRLIQTDDLGSMPPDPFGKTRITDLIYGGDMDAYSGNRDAALHDLLGPDYEYAHKSGLINDFYYNPTTGEDGLMHVLGGEYFIASDGTRIPRGFHHEPSANSAWVNDPNNQHPEVPRTYVDRTHLERKNSTGRREFAEFPYAPYHARVVIDGLKKMTLAKDRKTGETKLFETNNGMFPKEYDALSVMKAIRHARDKRDKTLDVIDKDNNVIFSTGFAPMLDGKTQMEIRLVLDSPSGKILSAYPLVRKRKMKLSRDEIKQHLGVSS